MSEADQRLERVVLQLRRMAPIDEAFAASEIAAAAREGGGAAALLAATIAGAGFGRERDWAEAFSWLVTAAQRGEAAAQAQLRFLGGAEHGDWQGLAQAIDVAALTAPRQTRMICERPRIGVGDGFLTKAECDWLIARASPLQKQAFVYGAGGRATPDSGRTNTEAMLSILELDVPTLLIRDRIAQTMNVPALNLELASVFRYTPGQTFKPHVDFIDPDVPSLAQDIRERGQRVMTFLVYLNDGFEGGETHFIDAAQRVRGGVGDAVFFYNVEENGAPDRMTRHEGAPPTSGEKWLLSQFIRDQEQCPG